MVIPIVKGPSGTKTISMLSIGETQLEPMPSVGVGVWVGVGVEVKVGVGVGVEVGVEVGVCVGV
jgi:hypothetical protein